MYFGFIIRCMYKRCLMYKRIICNNSICRTTTVHEIPVTDGQRQWNTRRSELFQDFSMYAFNFQCLNQFQIIKGIVAILA